MRCPKCGSVEISDKGDSRLECGKCKTIFQVIDSTANEIPACSVCGSTDPGRETFTCNRCGDKGICKIHMREGVCSTCYYDLKLLRRRDTVSEGSQESPWWAPGLYVADNWHIRWEIIIVIASVIGLLVYFFFFML